MWDCHRGSGVEYPNDSMWYWVQASFLAVCGHTLMTVCGSGFRLPSLLYVVLGSGVEHPNDRDIQVLISASFHNCARGLRCLLDACVCVYLSCPITRFVALEIQKYVFCFGSFLSMAECCVSGNVVVVIVCDLCCGGIVMCIYCFHTCMHQVYKQKLS